MKSPHGLPPIPWMRIATILVVCGIAFWAIGFLVGLVVRLAFGR
jgi:hypothetical protein